MKGRRTTSRVRRRLSRTMSPGRWSEYRGLLLAALEHGYAIMSLERWVLEGDGGHRAFLLRHDVDQHPRSALEMAAIEEELGLRSTWYFRWRTAHPDVITVLRERGFEVGLHYETLTRSLLESGDSPGDISDSLLEECRAALKREIAAFESRHGPIRSVCPHGDSRVPGVNNGALLRDATFADYGIAFDGNEAMRGRRLGHWLTDRSAAEGRWRERVDPLELLAAGVSPILCLTHPNNWASGPSLWTDRLLSAALPGQGWIRPIRTGTDIPPDPPAGSARLQPAK